jgi:hypothetical protein
MAGRSSCWSRAGTVKESGKLISLSGEPVPDVGSEHVMAGERVVKSGEPLPEREPVIRGQGDVLALQWHAVGEGRPVAVVPAGAQRAVGVVDARDEDARVDVRVVLAQVAGQPFRIGDDLARERAERGEGRQP